MAMHCVFHAPEIGGPEVAGGLYSTVLRRVMSGDLVDRVPSQITTFKLNYVAKRLHH